MTKLARENEIAGCIKLVGKAKYLEMVPAKAKVEISKIQTDVKNDLHVLKINGEPAFFKDGMSKNWYPTLKTGLLNQRMFTPVIVTKKFWKGIKNHGFVTDLNALNGTKPFDSFPKFKSMVTSFVFLAVEGDEKVIGPVGLAIPRVDSKPNCYQRKGLEIIHMTKSKDSLWKLLGGLKSSTVNINDLLPETNKTLQFTKEIKQRPINLFGNVTYTNYEKDIKEIIKLLNTPYLKITETQFITYYEKAYQISEKLRTIEHLSDKYSKAKIKINESTFFLAIAEILLQGRLLFIYENYSEDKKKLLKAFEQCKKQITFRTSHDLGENRELLPCNILSIAPMQTTFTNLFSYIEMANEIINKTLSKPVVLKDRFMGSNSRTESMKCEDEIMLMVCYDAARKLRNVFSHASLVDLEVFDVFGIMEYNLSISIEFIQEGFVKKITFNTREVIEARDELEEYAYNLNNQIGDNEKLGGKLSDEEKMTIGTATNKTIRWLEDNKESGFEEVQKEKTILETVIGPFMSHFCKTVKTAPTEESTDKNKL
uniref:Pre-PUA domain-containing protein n=1 Tax=Rhabditophanes sp. KR3021 TaxID=114890 RepID=A0AC35UA38_9BILA